MIKRTAAWSRTAGVLASVVGLATLLAACTPQRAMVGPGTNAPSPIASVVRPVPVKEVTVRDDGSTLELAIGQRFVLNLGPGYDWTVTISDSSILQRVVYDMIDRGAQGMYEAAKSGEATVTAAGEPRCRRAPSSCDVPSQRFTLAISVR